MLCTMHFGNGETIQTTCLEWAKCFVVNYQSCKQLFPTGKVHTPPCPICLPASAVERKGSWAQTTKQEESDEQRLRC